MLQILTRIFKSRFLFNYTGIHHVRLCVHVEVMLCSDVDVVLMWSWSVTNWKWFGSCWMHQVLNAWDNVDKLWVAVNCLTILFKWACHVAWHGVTSRAWQAAQTIAASQWGCWATELLTRWEQPASRSLRCCQEYWSPLSSQMLISIHHEQMVAADLLLQGEISPVENTA